MLRRFDCCVFFFLSMNRTQCTILSFLSEPGEICLPISPSFFSRPNSSFYNILVFFLKKKKSSPPTRRYYRIIIRFTVKNSPAYSNLTRPGVIWTAMSSGRLLYKKESTLSTRTTRITWGCGGEEIFIVSKNIQKKKKMKTFTYDVPAKNNNCPGEISVCESVKT